MIHFEMKDNNHVPLTWREISKLPEIFLSKSNIELNKEYDFEDLKKRTLEALNIGEYGSGLSIKEFHYFKVASVDENNNRTEIGEYPIYFLDEYKEFIKDNLPPIVS